MSKEDARSKVYAETEHSVNKNNEEAEQDQQTSLECKSHLSDDDVTKVEDISCAEECRKQEDSESQVTCIMTDASSVAFRAPQSH